MKSQNNPHENLIKHHLWKKIEVKKIINDS